MHYVSDLMLPRRVILSAALIVGTIIAGLSLRLIHLGLPFAVVKYGGSMLWALMIYWIVTALKPCWTFTRAAMASAAIAAVVEVFKLAHAPGLDAFRLTLPGALLLGRVFAAWDFLAYGVAIVLGALMDRSIRSTR